MHTKVYCVYCDPVWANLASLHENTKTVISQELTVAVTWDWYTRCPVHICAHCAEYFSSLPQAIQKLSQKVFIFDSFQDPCSFSFQDHCIVLLLGYSYTSCIWKGQIFSMKFPFKTFFQDPCTHSAVKLTQNTYLNHFKTLLLVSLQHNGQVESSYFILPTVRLESWWPTTCIWLVERSDHTCIKSIEHQEGNMVCNNCRLSWQGRFQKMEYITNLKRWGSPKGSRGSFSGHCRDPRGVDLLLEPYRWNLQQYQARMMTSQ